MDILGEQNLHGSNNSPGHYAKCEIECELPLLHKPSLIEIAEIC